MATRFLVSGRYAGDPSQEEWWRMTTEMVVRPPLDQGMRDIIAQAKRRGITVRAELPEYKDEVNNVSAAP